MSGNSTPADELAPCPFCGGEPKLGITSLDERSGYNTIYRIGCSVCSAMISGRSKENANGWQDDPQQEGKAQTIAAWNTRQPPSDAIRALAQDNHIKGQDKVIDPYLQTR